MQRIVSQSPRFASCGIAHSSEKRESMCRDAEIISYILDLRTFH